MISKALFTEPWAMEEIRLSEFARHISDQAGIEVIADIEIVGAQVSRMTRQGSKALIPISGILMKSVPSWMRWFGFAATGYNDIRSMVSEAAQDDTITSIDLIISSPGGQVAGILDAVTAIKRASGMKPVTAVCQDLCASAAYWLASQATTIVADSNTEVGSIGVYAVVVDSSKRAEEMGVKVHVIRSGEHKGAGVSGAPVSAEQLSAFEDVINAMGMNFKKTVASGRGLTLEFVETIATGRTWIAGAAIEHKLVDEIVDPESVEQVKSKKSKGANMKTDDVDTQVAAVAAAPIEVDTDAIAAKAKGDEKQRMSDLQAAFPKDLPFAIEQFNAGSTVQEAKAIYCDTLMAKAADKSKPAVAVSGAEPIDASGGEGDLAAATTDFMTEARLLKSKNPGMKKVEAMRMTMIEQPDLYRAFLARESTRETTINPTGKKVRISKQ